jgi:SAM-dependent methyltransferase
MISQHGNRQKHLSDNPLQKKLLNRFHRKITELVRQTSASCLLDVGCAEGFVIQYLRQQGLSIAAVGGDFDSEALLWGRSHVDHAMPLAKFDIHRLPYADNYFPLVMCLEVLEHLPNSVVAVQELARVSQEYVLLSVPHEPFFRGANFLRGKHLAAWGNDPEHFHNYTGYRFRQMVSRVLDIVWHGYSFPWQVALGRKRI